MIGLEPLSGLSDLNDSSSYSKRPIFRQPLPDEQFQSLGRRALNSGLGALQYIGGTLAKPGEAVRGVLSGRPSALKNLIPFSDTLGITNEADHISGRDLANQWGLTRKKDQGWGAWGAGLALDIATDPLTYIGGIGPKHSLTKLGEEAFKKGTLRNWTGRQLLEGFTDTEKGLRNAGYGDQIIEHLRDQGLKRHRIAPENITAEGGAPLAGLLKVGVPFGPHAVVGTGPLAQKVAGVADVLGDKLKYGNSLSRGLNALFDPAVGGATDEATQRAAAMYRAPTIRAQKAQSRFEKHDLLSALDPLISAAPEKEQIITQAARHAAEGGPIGITPNLNPELLAQVQPAAQAVRTAEDRIRDEMIARGINRDVADQFTKYVPRQSTEAAGAGPQINAKNSGLFPTGTGSNIRRETELRDIPGGTARINDWYQRFAGSKAPKGAIETDILGDMINDATAAGHQITPEVQKSFIEKANQIGRRIRRSDVKYQAKPYLSPDIESDITRRGAQHAYTMGNQAALVGGLADVAKKIEEGGETLEPLGEVIAKAGLKTTRGAEGQPLRGVLVDIHKALARQGMGMSDYLGTEKKILEEVNKYGVTPEHAQAFLRPYERPQLGEALQGPVSWLDTFNNAFKSLAYPLFPASHARNAATATLNNALVGAKPWETSQIGIMRGATPEAQAARRSQYGHAGIFEPERGAAHEVSGGIKKGLLSGERFTSSVPGEGIRGPTGTVLGDTANLIGNEGLLATGKAVRKAASGSVDELLHRRGDLGQAVAQNLGIRGVGGLERDTNPLIGAARKVSSNIENYFRGQMYNRLTKEGYSPEMAAEMIDKYHFNYGERTPFQRNVMSRVFPFGCVPADHEILTGEGWKTYDQLKIGEPVLSFNYETKELSWVPLDDVVTYDFDGDLYKIERAGRRLEPAKFLFTKDHRWPVEVLRTFVKGKWYGGERKILKSYELNTSHLIPISGDFRGTESILSPRHAAILGWVITDGYHRWRGNHCEMMVYQTPQKFLNEIIDLLGTKPRTPHPQTGAVCVPVSLEDSNIIKQVFKSKQDLLWIVSRLSRKSAEAMRDAMFKAEGWTTDKGNQGFAQEVNHPGNDFVLDAFQILTILTGQNANLNPHGCNIRRQKFLHPHFKGKKEFDTEYYKGVIWCPKTKHDTWVMRHDGDVIFTGNTYMQKNLPLQFETLTRNPRVIQTQLKPFQQQTPEGTGYVPNYLEGGLVLPLGPEQNGNRQYLSGFGSPAEEAFGRMHISGGIPDISRTAMDYLGNTTPVFKGPLERLFDRQFYSGRKLSDLRPQGAASLIGRQFGEENPNALAQALANSPATRFISSIDKLMDPRKTALEKAINLGTGARITDVDVERQRAIETRDAIAEMLKGKPHISSHQDFFVRPENIPKLTLEEIEALRLFSTQEARTAAWKKAQKQKQIGVAP